MAGFPKTRRRDLVSLAGRVLIAKLRGADPAEALSAWLRREAQRCGNPNFVIDLVVRRILFVSGPAVSQYVLAAPPSEQTFVAGTIKRKAMSFLAPNALTILHDNAWQALRAYNEAVLKPSGPDAFQPVLDAVERAFGEPVASVAEVRRRMGAIMLATVFGAGRAPEHLVDDLQELFDEVGLWAALTGSRKEAKRDAFRAELRRIWRASASGAPPSLLARAHDATTVIPPEHRQEDVLIDQIPHWMFPFTNSGSDLLVRALAVILARPAVLARVREEIAILGPHSAPEAFRLPYLEACILETARLFPPVLQTMHRAECAQTVGGAEIKAGTEILHHFASINRDEKVDPLANRFCPERWLDPNDPIRTHPPNTFLSGARACPGKDLILFIITAAVARIIDDVRAQPRSSPLCADPMPHSFRIAWAEAALAWNGQGVVPNDAVRTPTSLATRAR